MGLNSSGVTTNNKFLIPFTDEWERFFFCHFNREKEETCNFWRRFPETFDFEGKNILDFGSGSGYLSICLAECGAKKVIGLEIEENYTVFSTYNLENNFSQYRDCVTYQNTGLDGLEDESFEIIISKDVLEHVADLSGTLVNLVKKLKPGGSLILGFGPLWFSPFGDHGVSKKVLGFTLPWLHLMLSEKTLLKGINKERSHLGQSPVLSIKDYGMNQMSFREIKEILFSLELKLEYFNINTTQSKARYLNFIPVPKILMNFWARTIYCKFIKL